LAARVPRKPKAVLKRIVRQRQRKSLETKWRIVPEESEFWNRLVGPP
jgi:hypothetical protein